MSPDAAYWRDYRAKNREKLNAQERARRTIHRVRNRVNEYANRKSRAKGLEPLPPLFPDIVRGTKLSFWEQELAMDIRQERARAMAEGLDPDEAEKTYRAIEMAWRRNALPMMEDIHPELGYRRD